MLLLNLVAHRTTGKEDEMPETTLKPEHMICERNVRVPTVSVVRFTPATEVETVRLEARTDQTQPLQPGQNYEVDIQWFGDAEEVDLGGSQFLFPTGISTESVHWFGHPEKFGVVFLGPATRWPRPDAAQAVADSVTNGDPNGILAWVASAHYGTEHSDGPGPACFAFPMKIMLADPVVGIIKPRFFSDITVLDRINEEFRRQLAR